MSENKELSKRLDRLEKLFLNFEKCCDMPPRIDTFTYAKDGQKTKKDDPYHITCLVCNHTVRGIGIVNALNDWNQSIDEKNSEENGP